MGKILIPSTVPMNLPVFYLRLSTCLASFVAICSVAEAAIAPLNDEMLKNKASHIIVGKVIKRHSQIKKSTVEKSFGIHLDTLVTLTVEISEIQKGKELGRAKKIVIETWSPHTRIPSLPGPQGHCPIPKKGDDAIFYLIRKEKSFQPLLPNGIRIKNALKGP